MKLMYLILRSSSKFLSECLNDAVEMFKRRSKKAKSCWFQISLPSVIYYWSIQQQTQHQSAHFQVTATLKRGSAPQRKPNDLMLYRSSTSIRNLQTKLIWLKSETSLQKSMKTEKVYLVNFLTTTLKFKKYLYIFKYLSFFVPFFFFSQHFLISNF